MIAYAKLHRHYRTKIILFSQSHEDMDITFRRLASSYYLTSRSLIPGFFHLYRISSHIDIDDLTHKVTDFYTFDPLRFLTAGYTFGRRYYRYYDSYSRPLDLEDVPIDRYHPPIVE